MQRKGRIGIEVQGRVETVGHMNGAGSQTGFSQTGAGIKVMLAGVFFPLGADSFIRRWVYIDPAQEQPAFNLRKTSPSPKPFSAFLWLEMILPSVESKKLSPLWRGIADLNFLSNPLPKYRLTGRLMSCSMPEVSLIACLSYCSRSADIGHGPR